MNSELDLKGALYTSTDIYNKVMAQANCTQDEFNEIMNFHNSQDEIEFDRELNNRKRRVNVGLRTKEISADQLSNDFESVNNWLFLLKNQSQFLHETEQIDKSIKDPDANVSSGETVENNALNLYSFQTSLVRQLRKIIETKESPTTARLVELYTTASNNLKLREEVHFRLSRNLDEANRKLIESSTENEELTDMISDLDKKLEGFKDQKNYEEIQKAKKYNIIQHEYQKNKKDLLKQIDLAETEINGYKIKEKTEVKLLIQLRHNEEDASKLIIAYQDKIIQMESDIKNNEASYKQLLLTLEKELKSRRTGQVAGEKRQTSDIKKKMTSNSSKELTTFKKSSTSNNKQTEKDLKKYDGSDDKSVENAIQYLDNYQETTIKQTKEIFDKEIKELQQILADEQANIQMECNQLYNEKVSNITKERDMELSNKYRLKGLLNDREIELKSVSQQLEIYEGILSDVTHEYKTTKKANKEKKQQLTGNEKQKWEKRKLMKASIKSIDYFIDKANFIIDLFKKKLKERMDKAISTEYPFKTGSKTDIKKRSLKEKVKRSNSMLFGKEKDEKLGIDPFVRIKNYNYERDDLRMSVRFIPSFTPKQPSNVTFQAGANQPKVGRRMSKITSSTNIANHPVNRRMSTFTGPRAKLGQNNPDIQSKIKKQHSIDLETFHEMNSNKNEFQNKINKQQSVDFKSLRSNTNNNAGESFPTMKPNINNNGGESFPTMKPNTNSNENESFPTMKPNTNSNENESFPTMKPNTNSNENESFPTMKPNTNSNENESFPTMKPNINNGAESFPTMKPNTNSNGSELFPSMKANTSTNENESFPTMKPNTSTNESESFPTMKANTSSNGGESFPTMKPNINSNVRESFPTMKPNASTNDSESFPTMKPNTNNNESSLPQLSTCQIGNDDSESKITFPSQISEIEGNGNENQLKEKLENTVVNKISPSNSKTDENAANQTKISPTISKATDPLKKETKDDDEATDSFKNNNIQKNETQTVSEEKVADSSADSGKEKAVYINDTDDDVSKITSSSSKTDQNGVVNKVEDDSKQVKIAPSSSKTEADDSPKQSKLSPSNSQSNDYTNVEKNSASNSNTYNSTTIEEISPSNSKTNDNSSKQNKVSQSNRQSNDLTNNEKNRDSDSKTDSDTVNQNKITPSNSKTDDKHSNQKVTQNPVETTSQPNFMHDASSNIECKKNDDIKINTTSITKNSLKNEKQEETETTEPDSNSITNAELDRVSNENQNDQTSDQINPNQPSEIKNKDDEITDSIQQEKNNAIQSENNQTKPIQIHQPQIKNDNETSATPKSHSQQQNEIKPIQIQQPQTQNFNEASATPETNSRPTSETKPIQIHQPQTKNFNETSATPETDFQLQNETKPIQIHHPQTKNDNATSITPETDSQSQNEAIQHYESSDPNPTQNETDTSTTDHTSPITTKHDSSPSTITPQSSTDSQTRHEERGIQPDPVKSLPTILNDEDIKLVRAPMILKGKNTRHRVTITNKNATKSSDAENETQEPTKNNKTMKEDSIVTVTQPPEDNTKTKTTKSTKETVKSTNKVDARSIMPTFDIRVFKSVGGRFVNTNLCYDPEEDFVDIKTGQICHKYRHWNGTSSSFDPELDFYDDSGILHHIYKVSLKNIHKNKNKNKQNPELEQPEPELNDNDNEKVDSVPPIPIQTINSNKKPRHKSATTSISNSSSFFTPTRKRNDDENQILPHQYLMPVPNSLGISPLTYRKRISNSPPQRPLYYSMKSNKPDSIENNDSLHVTPMNDKISTRSQESFSSKSLRVFTDQKDTETPKSARCFRSKKKGELIDKNMIDTEPLLPPLSPNGSSVKKLDQSVTISNQEVPLPRVPKVTQLTENDGMSVTPRRLNFHNRMPNSDPLGENTSPRRNRASRDLNFMRGSMDLSSRKNGRIVDVKTLSPRMKKSNQVSNSQPNMVSNENNENSI